MQYLLHSLHCNKIKETKKKKKGFEYRETWSTHRKWASGSTVISSAWAVLKWMGNLSSALLTLTKQTQLSDLCGFLLLPLFPIAFRDHSWWSEKVVVLKHPKLALFNVDCGSLHQINSRTKRWGGQVGCSCWLVKPSMLLFVLQISVLRAQLCGSLNILDTIYLRL